MPDATPSARSPAPRVGLFPPPGLLSRGPDTAREYLARVGEAGIDYVCCGDHVSFFGLGFDGLVQATALAMLHPVLPVHLGVYLLPLRHPVLVARQLADFAQLAPGRLVLGVGVGGEDRHEISVCGVDPATRGRRMNECLAVVRQLLDGGAVSFHGAFFDLDEVVIAPAPAVPIPVVVGGRSDEAVRRAGRLGDGWLGIWNSPQRFAAATALAAEEAARTARTCPPSRHAMQVWCGLADSRQAARACAAPAMEAFYQLPFERYCPYGTAEDVADFLTRYVDAGCTEFNLIPQSPDEDAAGISSFPILSRFSRPAPRAREHRCGYTRNCIRIRLALCGPDRRSGDGLRICVGPVPGTVLLRPRPPGSAFGVRPAANTRIDS